MNIGTDACYSAWAGATGSHSTNVEPAPTSLFTDTSPAHEPCQSSADGEAETRAAMRVLSLRLHAWLKNRAQSRGRNAVTCVVGPDVDPRSRAALDRLRRRRVGPARADGHATAARCELDGVRQQIHQHLANARLSPR